MEFSVWPNDNHPPLNDAERAVFEACVIDVRTEVDAVAMASMDCRLIGRLANFANLSELGLVRSVCKRDHEIEGLVDILAIIQSDYLLDTDQTNEAFELAMKRT